jgi:hypothetical protein
VRELEEVLGREVLVPESPSFVNAVGALEYVQGRPPKG